MLKKNLMVASTIGLVALVGGQAQAQQQTSTTFTNNFSSRLIVSPAQLYQTQDLKTDFGVTYGAAEAESKATGLSATDELTTTSIFLSGIYNISPIGLRAGLQANYLAGTETDGLTDKEQDVTTTVITPVVAYAWGPIAVGAGVDITQDASKPEAGDTAKVSYNTFKTGVLYAQDQLEAGIAYRAPQRIIAAKADEKNAVYPAEVILHGRYAAQPNLAVGGIVTNENWKAHGEDFLKDRITTTVTTEYTLDRVKVEGDLGYNTAFYKNKDFVSESLIATWDLGVGADYSINDKSTVGGVVGYEFGSDKANDVEYAVNELTVGVRGNLRF